MSLLEMRGIVKEFPGLRAVDQVDLSVKEREIHALLGENGAGKTTLMNILYGLYRQEAGEIFWKGVPVQIARPSEAIALGIGMVHQHFMLVRKMTALENIILGLRTEGFPLIRRDALAEQISVLSQKYGLHVDLNKRIDHLSVGEQQRVEILKALFRNAHLLILDEPTSVLTPQEIQEFFRILRILRDEGHSIILIAHNLSEILAISDRVTVLRDGKKVCTVETAKTDERELSHCMIGRELAEEDRVRAKTDMSRTVLEICDVSLQGPAQTALLSHINLRVYSGEILGIAGIDGNGQLELSEILVGLRAQSDGHILLNGTALDRLSSRKRWEMGLTYIPADRHQDGLIMDADACSNYILRSYYCAPFSKAHILQFAGIRRNAEELTRAYQVKMPSISTQARLLSGGNQQKMILARELQSEGNLTIACQPTRGLDIGAAEYLRQRLLERRDCGKSVLLISTDLEEILSLSDRIAVIHGGKIMGVVDNSPSLSIETLGLMMGGMALEAI